MHCPGRNATDPIWRVLASSDEISSDGISSWTPLKPQHSNPTPNPLANQLRCIDSLSDARFMQDSPKAVRSIPCVFVAFFPSLKHNFIAYRSSKVSARPDCIFEIHQLWQSGFRRVYSNCYCSCSFEPEIIKIGQSSHKMYSNKKLKFPESTTILNTCTKNVWKRIECTTYFRAIYWHQLNENFLELFELLTKRGPVLNEWHKRITENETQNYW